MYWAGAGDCPWTDQSGYPVHRNQVKGWIRVPEPPEEVELDDVGK
jgi:hypothetical protein